MIKRLTVSGIVSISLAFALMAGGCGKSEEKAEVPSKAETAVEHAATEHAPAVEKAHEAVGSGQVHEEAEVKGLATEAVEAAKETGTSIKDAGMGMLEKAAEKVEEMTGTAEEHAAEAPDVSAAHGEMEEEAAEAGHAVKKKMFEGC